jgi:hypothetical protein
MTRIVVSHRVEDEPYGAGQLIDALAGHFGPEEVAYASADLPPTEEQSRMLRYDVRSARMVVAVIGPRWLDARDPVTAERRMTTPTDWVRVQLAEAFRHGVQVIPVLLRDTPMPATRDLPPEVAVLVWRTALRVNPGRPAEMADLVKAVNVVLDQPRVPRSRLWPSRPIRDPYERSRVVNLLEAEPLPATRAWTRPALVAGAAAVVLAAVVGVALSTNGNGAPPDPVPARFGTPTSSATTAPASPGPTGPTTPPGSPHRSP